ncbi:CdiA C-terminal domain-containing protein [Saccharopolyspora phatthalungensis]|uniref:tRNA nuclease CdiA C-terminal domain-containing protein n=1 Tax=Saccharopolyspora phatthalungensis TaxID=664693 RepID=A0A840QJW3_9PSEU|nr:hypothetical protein [Saccharopolyspora phatthalungensis]MBB5159519.1 hypothetical protein [Saccharopolyspora phatthalungensis]
MEHTRNTIGDIVEDTSAELAAVTGVAIVVSLLTTPIGGGVVEGGAGAAVVDAAGVRMAAVASEFVIAIGGAVSTVAAAEAGAALAMAINNTPDPNVTQHEATQVSNDVGRGTIDESAGKFTPEERRLAERLAAEGKDVKKIPESTTPGLRTPDALVDGRPTEFKGFTKPDPNDLTLSRTLEGSSKKGGQAREIIIDATDKPGFTQEMATKGVERFLGKDIDGYDKIRVIGDGWNFTWP